MQALITGTIGVIVFLICFFVLRLIFVAPFQLYRRQRKEVETLQSNLQEKQKQLDDLVNGNTPDLPFGDAIALVGELFPGRGYSDEENASQIVKMLFREKISAWGQPPLLASMVPLATTPIKIPHEFFYSPNYGPTENDGYSFEVFTSLPGWEDWRDHEQYLNVMVNRGQVIAAFSNKSPM